MDAWQKLDAARGSLIDAATTGEAPPTAVLHLASAVKSLADAVGILLEHSTVPREVER